MLDRDYTVVSPAYGRDYKSAKTAKDAFLAGNDFMLRDIENYGRYCSVRDFAPGTIVNIRYRSLMNVTPCKVPSK